jgi:hypothetical protein
MYKQMLYMGIVPNNLIFPWMMKCLLEKFGIWNGIELVWKDE